MGVPDIKELLQAGDEQLMREIMIPEVIALTPESTLKEAYALFERYNLRALPMTDEENQRIADHKGISDRLLDQGEWYQILLQQQAQAQMALTSSHWHLHHHPAGVPGGECGNEQNIFKNQEYNVRRSNRDNNP